MSAALEWSPADGSLIVVPGRKARVCAHCHGPLDRPGQRYCRRCHSTYMREWRAAQPKPGDIRRQYGQEVDDPEVIAKAIAEWNTRAAPIQVEVPRELTDDERTFAEALESALTEHADVWQALADLDAGKERK